MAGSPFAALDAVASATLAAVMGEAWTLMPQAAAANVNAPTVPDPARAQRALTGIYSDRAIELRSVNDYDPRTVKRPGIATSEPNVEFDPRLAANAGMAIKARDILVRVADNSYWRVAYVNGDGMGRLAARINLNGKA